MTRLMQRAEQRLAQVVRFDARGDAHIADGEAGAEGVRRFVLTPASDIVAEGAGDFLTERELLVFRKFLMKAGIVRRGLCGDSTYQRHKLFAQRAE